MVKDGPAHSRCRGPTDERQCRDILWLLLFLVYIVCFITLSSLVIASSDANRLFHGKDHNRNYCGLGKREATPKVYYPRLNEDFRSDPTLATRYGVCVKDCPAQGETVQDYDDAANTTWFVPLPSFPVAGRCIPYQTAKTRNGTQMCAYPRCEPTVNGTLPQRAQQVCGLELDGTSKYWLLGKPDALLLLGWQAESGSQEVIDARSRIAAAVEADRTLQASCEVVVVRSTSVALEQRDSDLPVQLLTKYTGVVFSTAQTLWSSRAAIFLLGLLGSLLLSAVLIALFSYCVKVVLTLGVLLLLVVLAIVDYLLLVQANVATGQTGRYVADFLSNTRTAQSLEQKTGLDLDDFSSKMLQSQQSSQMQTMYLCLGVALAIFIVALVCILASMRRNFRMLAALLQEASKTVRGMPALLLLPFIGVASITGCTLFLTYTVLGALTLDADRATWLRAFGADPQRPETVERAQEVVVWVVIFSFLWVYFFHMAVYVTTVAGAVSHWYFYRSDPESDVGRGCCFCTPVLRSLGRALRYHLGSLALGSLLLAVCTMPRLLLEFYSEHMKAAGEQNSVLRCVIRVTRCCLYCMETCIKFLTEYAYIDIAVTGNGFCTAAHESFVLVAKYPAQVALDTIASKALTALAGLLVPTVMVIISYRFVNPWLVPAAMIAFLAFMVTRLAAGVYDIAISALFIAAIHDLEHYEGAHATGELRAALGLDGKAEAEAHAEAEARVEVELS